MDKIEIMETKQAAKEDLIYFAIKDQETIKEIHFRRAASRNTYLTVRDYIPPQYPHTIHGSCKKKLSRGGQRTNY